MSAFIFLRFIKNLIKTRIVELMRPMKVFDYKSSDFWKSLEKACEPASMSGDIPAIVSSVIADVRARGDKALEEFTLKFDGAKVPAKSLAVTETELKAAAKAVPA